MRLRPRLVAAAALTALVAGLLTVTPPAGTSGSATAAVAADFEAGYLVSDEQFYDGGAMTAAQVAPQMAKAAGTQAIDTGDCVY